MATELPFSFQTSGLEFRRLPWEERPHNVGRIYGARSGTVESNDEGIRGIGVRGDWYNHPVRQSTIAYTRLDIFTITGDPEYLEVATDYAEYMMAIADIREDGVFLPYSFTRHMHGLKEFPMAAPWYSGMGQGYALIAFCRLYELTQEPRYLEFAHKLFNSFLLLRSETEPWFTHLLDDQYVWFEEYPSSEGPSCVVFNGHIFAIYGLYEYWLLTGDERAMMLADGGMTSVLAHMDKWRSPGGLSFYCVTHRLQPLNYHHVHVEQLGWLHALTGHPIWLTLQDRFMEDHPSFTMPRLSEDILVVKPGTYTVGWHGDLSVTRRQVVSHDREEQYQCNLRGRMVGDPRIYCRIWEESRRTRFYPESADTVYLLGVKEHYKWSNPREMRVVWDQLRVAEFDLEEDVKFLRDQTATEFRDTMLEATERALIFGQTWLKIAGGVLDGSWVPMRAVEPVDR